MTENHINNLAYNVAKQVWKDSRTAENFQQAREMVVTLFNDDDLVKGIPGISARSHQVLIYDEAVRRLTDATSQTR